MALTEAFSISAVTIGVTEWSIVNNSSSIATSTAAGWYCCLIDFGTAIAAGDTFEFKVYEKVLSGGTQRLVYSFPVTGVQSAPIWPSPTLPLMWGWDMTLKKLAGTDRAISASIRKAA